MTKDKSNRLLAAIITSRAGKVNNNLKAAIANGRKENRQAIQFHGLAAAAGLFPDGWYGPNRMSL